MKTLFMLMLLLEQARGRHVGDPWSKQKFTLADRGSGFCVSLLGLSRQETLSSKTSQL